jgi:hypothetical protein
VRQSEDRAVTVWVCSQRRVRLCRTFPGIKSVVMKWTFSCSLPPGCSRSWDSSLRLVRVNALQTLRIDRGGHVVIRESTLHGLVSVIRI